MKKSLLIILIIFWGTWVSAQDIAVRNFPAPETVSPEIQPLVTGKRMPFWNDHPKTAEQWKSWVNQIAQVTIEQLPHLRNQMQVEVEPAQFASVKGFIITPNHLLPENRSRILIHFHGGGYVLNPGEAGTDEAIMMAGFGQIKVISIDYRMPPDFPFPAAIDDAVTAYREILKTYPPEKIGVFGTSTGGGMTLALMLRAKAEGLPLPAAIVVGTPWTDMTKTGDSYFTHEGIDNVLVSYDGWLGDAAKLYANTYDLKNPLLSPVYGDVQGLPPTLLITGTRDLFLSNTVRMHLKLREAGVTADLLVFEGVSHAQYLMAVDSPETKQYFKQSNQFFKQYLAN
ncbi:alpha/beta hydrolase [Serratia sp. 3ACOL1]|uniref:alpha/beta hydrolase n=1 Tax=Serratia sp. 3ACOL1 TaxID=2448483 RepID=UPI000EF48230|nr:alpha/beta hydrolase [Serratia sp. 3ACOL1]AYM91022.1 alpha/beta hydrolase [Serratia sp. 3ACOL1]